MQAGKPTLKPVAVEPRLAISEYTRYGSAWIHDSNIACFRIAELR